MLSAISKVYHIADDMKKLAVGSKPTSVELQKNEWASELNYILNFLTLLALRGVVVWGE